MKKLLIAMAVIGLTFFALRPVPAMEQRADAGSAMPAITATAVFAGGCFWCTESDFEKLPGVIDAISGYTGGTVANPSYEQVSAGGTGHVESVKVIYDPAKLSYSQLLDWFWRHVDPTDAGGQFVDRGSQYQSEIFYANDEQKRLAEASKAKLEASGKFDKPIVTKIVPLGPFYPAEDYHQDYYKKNPIRYHYYRWGSGRDQFLEKVWGKDVDKLPAKTTDPETMPQPMPDKDMTDKGMMDKSAAGMASDKPMSDQGMMDKGMATAGKEESMSAMTETMPKERTYTIPDDATLRKTLTPLQYRVTRENGTESPFQNAYWDNHEAGIYVDIISGEPLFSSTDKFDSGTGWPSFIRPLASENVVEVKHVGLFGGSTEVRSKHADSHLGDLFHDGPQPTGLRYCIDSAALRFIPKADLEKEGYGEYLKLFDKKM